MSDPNDPFLQELLSDPNADDASVARDLERLAGAPVAPRAGLRARLLDSTEREHRFDELVDVIANEVDLGRAQVDALLLAVDDAKRWEDGPAAGISLLHFEGGPSRQRHITGFVRLAAGGGFPEHGHLGDETVVILQGAFRDTYTGETYERGAVVRTSPDVEHELVVVSDVPAIYLAVVAEGVTVGGEAIRYDDPRG